MSEMSRVWKNPQPRPTCRGKKNSSGLLDLQWACCCNSCNHGGNLAVQYLSLTNMIINCLVVQTSRLPWSSSAQQLRLCKRQRWNFDLDQWICLQLSVISVETNAENISIVPDLTFLMICLQTLSEWSECKSNWF